jgi:hypothetical protein
MEGLKANDLLYYTHLLTGMPNELLCYFIYLINEKILLLFIWISFCCYFAGYIGSVSFLNTVLEVVKKLRSINPKLTYGEWLIPACLLFASSYLQNKPADFQLPELTLTTVCASYYVH